MYHHLNSALMLISESIFSDDLFGTDSGSRGVTSLFGDRRYCCFLSVAEGHSKLGGSGGMPPRNIFNFRPSEKDSDALSGTLILVSIL